MNDRSGKFITLEGIEGAGKSTHMPFISSLLQVMGKEIVMTREPGGTSLGEEIRNTLLMQKSFEISGNTELLLMFAARQQHLEEIIYPALNKGKTVLCDRFTDSSYAYQGGGRGIETDKICQLVQLVHPDLKPDLTLLFDLPVEVGLARANMRDLIDRFESETINFFQSVRNAYLKIADAEPNRVKVIDATANIKAVQNAIKTILKEQGLC
ncbi:MAG: dTMP kinase [Gammaproteobacteria bacterium]|nr:dTMP kinase [Gammaproteobacteria bacterium]